MSSDKFDFETLIKSKNILYSNRWKPLTIGQYENAISRGNIKSMSFGVKKNISYSIQYLEYISFQLSELTLNAAIHTMLIKNYIVIGSSIIEALMYCLIDENGLNTKSDLKLLYTNKTNSKKLEDKDLVIETNVYLKTESYCVEMTYDAMIKKIESKKLLNITHNVFPYIKKFRNLRNRVHLQISSNKTDTDWFNFNDMDYLLMKYILYLILTDKNILGKNENIYYFLKLSISEQKTLKEYIDNKKNTKVENPETDNCEIDCL